jgi:hypothetical protein
LPHVITQSFIVNSQRTRYISISINIKSYYRKKNQEILFF